MDTTLFQSEVMCVSHSKKETDIDMLKEVVFSKERSKERIEELKQGKTPVKIKNGIMLIDKSHPDYEYWMED